MTAIEMCSGLEKPLVAAMLPMYTAEAYASTLRFQEVCARHEIAVFPNIRRATWALARLLDWESEARARLHEGAQLERSD